ncbi:barstar family protein [Streptomyces sp. NPDC048419]|uniref:barstar family protein n=1 Tax=Streptomyces sp. NPDC048419 TaxID=3365547 RepID=UPI003718DBD6
MTELVVTLDLDGVTDKAGLMDRCARALRLPDWFGRNWDALADSLGDHTVWPEGAAERGLLLVVRGWRPFAKARPDEWETAQEVFAEAADRTPALSVALALGGSSE